NRVIQDIFKDPVEITEKVDGSQFGFGKIDGELYLRSKGAQLFIDNPQKMFEKGVEYIYSIQDRLPDNVVFWGEYLEKPKHNILKYNRIPKNHIMVFGAYDITHDKFCHLDEIQSLIEQYSLELETVPLIYKGLIENPDQLLEIIERESVLGGASIEGVVVKNYFTSFMIGNKVYDILSGKFVSEKFKEVHRSGWKEKSSKSNLDRFFESFNTEARWHKAIQHLKEKDELEFSPKDIGSLLKEIHLDIEQEEKENVKEFLWKEFSGALKRKSTAGFPEWYKEWLLKLSFEDNN
ncbi:MAG: hypothetical protein GTO02_06165, partial [Candidatus Dadabacteria bacterium]|nr:hypothetical protein [Candidatus Dadabacteria bacterium]